MQRNEKTLRIEALQKKIARLRHVMNTIEEKALGELHANPDKGWVMNETIE